MTLIIRTAPIEDKQTGETDVDTIGRHLARVRKPEVQMINIQILQILYQVSPEQS